MFLIVKEENKDKEFFRNAEVIESFDKYNLQMSLNTKLLGKSEILIGKSATAGSVPEFTSEGKKVFQSFYIRRRFDLLDSYYIQTQEFGFNNYPNIKSDLAIIKKEDGTLVCVLSNFIDRVKFYPGSSVKSIDDSNNNNNSSNKKFKILVYHSPTIKLANGRISNINELVMKFQRWNRWDLLEKLILQAKEYNIPIATNENLHDADIKRIGGTEKGPGNHAQQWADKFWDNNQWQNRNNYELNKKSKTHNFMQYNAQHPLVIHFHSVVSFLRANPGNAFTGIVMLTELSDDPYSSAPKIRTRPIIVLIPLQSSIGSTNNPKEVYGVQRYNEAFITQIYNTNSHAITHLNEHPAAHNQLLTHIRNSGHQVTKINDNIANGEGNFIGFTILKGKIGQGNRYAFTSQTANESTFGGLYTSMSWGQAISAACDKLSELESELDQIYGSKENAANTLMFRCGAYDNSDAPSYNIGSMWVALCNRYWPDVAADTSVVTNKSEKNDEWGD